MRGLTIPTKAPATRALRRGLRVRVGLHSGIRDVQDAVLNKTTGRVQYGGQPLALAKAVADVGHGGMVLLTQASCELLPAAQLRQAGVLLAMGLNHLDKSAAPGEAIGVYQLLPADDEHRLAFFRPHLRPAARLAEAGTLHAPIGQCCIAFAHMVGAQTLLAWDQALASAAIATFQAQASQLLMRTTAAAAAQQQFVRSSWDVALGVGSHQPLPESTGYCVEMAGGLCLAAFQCPCAAVLWALELVDSLLEADWDPELLAHELCETVAVREHVELFDVASVGRDERESVAEPASAQWLNGRGGVAEPPGAAPRSTARVTGMRRCVSNVASLLAVQATARSTTSGLHAAVGAASNAPHEEGRGGAQSSRAADVAASGANSCEATTTEALVRKLFRGPRIKIGLDIGNVWASLNRLTGRVSYRGRVMNRTARIAEKAGSGQVRAIRSTGPGCPACAQRNTRTRTLCAARRCGARRRCGRRAAPAPLPPSSWRAAVWTRSRWAPSSSRACRSPYRLCSASCPGPTRPPRARRRPSARRACPVARWP